MFPIGTSKEIVIVKYLLVFCLALGNWALADSPGPVLLADFADKPVNQPIGTGGAAQGEPVTISPSIDAVVRAAPGGGRELELAVGSFPSTQSVRFGFLDSEEVTVGRLKSRIELRLGSADQFSQVSLLMREAGGSAQSFLNLLLFFDGEAVLTRSGLPAMRFPDAALLSSLNVIDILYDLDELTFSLCMNGLLLAADLVPGIQTKRGIGSLLLSLPANTDTVVWLDRIEVTKGTTSDRLFSDRFQEGFVSCPF